MQILETKVSLFPGRRRLTFKKLNLDSSHVGNEGVHSLCLADDVITLTGPQELANADLKFSSLDLSGNDFTESDELAAGPLLARLVRNHTKLQDLNVSISKLWSADLCTFFRSLAEPGNEMSLVS